MIGAKPILVLFILSVFCCKATEEEPCPPFFDISTKLIFRDSLSQENISEAVAPDLVIFLLDENGKRATANQPGLSFLIDRFQVKEDEVAVELNRSYSQHLITIADIPIDTLSISVKSFIYCDGTLKSDIESIVASNGSSIEKELNRFKVVVYIKS